MDPEETNRDRDPHRERGPHLLLLPGTPPLLLPLHLGVFDLAHAHAHADRVGGRRLVGRVPEKGQRQWDHHHETGVPRQTFWTQNVVQKGSTWLEIYSYLFVFLLHRWLHADTHKPTRLFEPDSKAVYERGMHKRVDFRWKLKLR